jgi:hypothetical protein
MYTTRHWSTWVKKNKKEILIYFGKIKNKNENLI